MVLGKKIKYTYILGIIIIVLLFMALPQITYTIDSKRIAEDKGPIFVIKIAEYKEGGTSEYIGLGYQVINWHRYGDNGIDYGIIYGYEIYKAPNFRDIAKGPTKELKLKAIGTLKSLKEKIKELDN